MNDDDFLDACKTGYLKIVSESINCKDKYGWSGLCLASYYGHTNVVELLISNGANLEDKDNCGRTALTSAILNEKYDVIHILLKNGADIDAQDETGNTPIFTACINENINMMLYLYEQGTDFYLENDDGESAIDILIENNSQEEKIIALKEKLILESLIDKHEDIALGL